VTQRVSFREWRAEDRDRFVTGGHHPADFFAHRVYCAPRAAPNHLAAAKKIADRLGPDDLWLVTLHATDPRPSQSQPAHSYGFGLPGCVASARLIKDENRAYCLGLDSDASVQGLLLNAVLTVVASWRLAALAIPASCAREAAIYETQRDADWLVVDLARSKPRIVLAEPRHEDLAGEKMICVCHDIERELGHLIEDPPFAESLRTAKDEVLHQMLAVERQLGIQATYNVVGTFLPEVRDAIAGGGHTIAFHSFDHVIAAPDETTDQLARCRAVDGAIAGYRPPQSRLSLELSDEKLCRYGIEWLASGAKGLGTIAPRLDGRVVKIPIAFDDFSLYSQGISFENWREDALRQIEASPFVAFSLHDCYGQFWLAHYEEFLIEVMRHGQLRTCDKIADRIFLSQTV
jgi:hypothetical protein